MSVGGVGCPALVMTKRNHQIYRVEFVPELEPTKASPEVKIPSREAVLASRIQNLKLKERREEIEEEEEVIAEAPTDAETLFRNAYISFVSGDQRAHQQLFLFLKQTRQQLDLICTIVVKFAEKLVDALYLVNNVEAAEGMNALLQLLLLLLLLLFISLW